MSSYWQGKGAGKRIAIRFNKPLLGDVTGNEMAFTIKGMVRNPLKYGPLTEKTFTVESVERYPIEQYWQDDFSGQMDGVEVGENGLVLHKPTMAVTDSAAYETVSGTSLQGTVEANAGDFVLATVSIRDSNPTPTPSGWILIYETYTPHTSFDQRLAFFCKEIEASGTVSFTATQPVANRLYLNLVAISGIEGFEAKPEMTVVRTTEEGAFPVPDKSPGEPLIWGCVTPLWKSSAPYTDWATTPNDLLLVSLDQEVTQPRLANFVDLGDGAASGRTMQASPTSTGTYVAVSAVKPLNVYSTPGTYTATTPADTLPTNPRLKWTENLPIGTSITAEYAVNQDALTTPTTWTPINESDLLTIPDPATGYFLWLRFTLATTDTAVTPTLLAMWLEEAEAPPDTIVLRFDTYNRFNDAEGDITVAYSQALGTLTGNRPVADFEESFTPTDLEPTPIDRHDITAGIEVAVDLIKVDYIDLGHKHTITAGITVEVDLIPVSEIPP